MSKKILKYFDKGKYRLNDKKIEISGPIFNILSQYSNIFAGVINFYVKVKMKIICPVLYFLGQYFGHPMQKN